MTKFGLLGRFGTFFSVLAIVALTTGCPLVNILNPCFNVNCNDEDPCTTDTCSGGECSNTPIEGCCETAADCNDNDVCTADACNIEEGDDSGTCANTDIEGCCNDNADCAEGEVCENNACVPECVDNADCADNDDCTINTCEEGSCVSEDVVCGEGETCVAGECVSECAEDADCADDGDLCTTESCVNGACVSDDVACEEGQTCNPDTGECEADEPDCVADVDCDDGDDCTDDTCEDGVCVFTNNTSACDDGNACTTGDTCSNGACTGTPVSCPSGQTCNPATGNCQTITCTTNADCNDGASCTADVCNLGTGECEFTPLDTACNDNLFCNGTEGAGSCDPDAEDGSGCVRPGNPCSNPTPVCVESSDTCVACTTNAQCDDGFSCTSDTCNAGSCQNTPLDTSCPDPLKCDGDDICDPSDPEADETTGCYAPGNPCAPRVCNEASYVVGDPNTCVDCTSNADCSDGITCTEDVCDGGTGNCSNNDDDTLCPDPLFCNGDDICDPSNPDADPTTGCISGLTSNPPGNYPCANACNEATNTCFDCTSNLDCSDGIACTTDTCNGGTGACTHTDNCAVGTCNVQTGQCE